jgi:hypothetical protein
MQPNASLVRSSDAAFSYSTLTPPQGGPYRLKYSQGAATGIMYAGVESEGFLKSLYTDLSGTLRVSRKVTITDSLSVRSGSMELLYDSLQSARMELSGLLDVRPGASINSGSGGLCLVNRSVHSGGRIGVLPELAGFAGSVNVEHFLTGPVNSFRYLASPVQRMTVGELSDDLKFNSGSAWTYDESALGSKENGWVKFPTTNTPVAPGSGFVVRTGGILKTSKTWDVTGHINRGSIELPVTWTPTGSGDLWQDGWNLVGNPFPSPVQWSLNPAMWSDKSGGPAWRMDPVVFVRDAQSTLRTWDASTGIGDLSDGTGILPAGTAFWVHANGPAPELVIHEAAKAPTGGRFYRKSKDGRAVQLQFTTTKRTVNCFLILIPGASSKWIQDEDVRMLSDTLQSVSLLSSDGKNLLHYVTDELNVPVPIQFLKEEEVVSLTLKAIEGWEIFPLWIEDRLKRETTVLDTAKGIVLQPAKHRYFLHGKPSEKNNIEFANRRLHIIPNPLEGQVMRMENPEGSVIRVVIIDLLGRPVEELSIDSSLTVFERKLDLIPGMYTALLHTQTEVFRERFIIED